MRRAVDHVNKNYLCLKNDSKLMHINVWRHYFQTHYGPSVTQHPIKEPSHRAIYIIKRQSSPQELEVGRQFRKKSPSTEMIGPDINEYDDVIIINQSNCQSLFYTVPNLHANNHGSIDLSDLPNRRIILDFMDIRNNEIDNNSSGKSGTFRYEDIWIAYDKSRFVKSLNKKMLSGGLQLFHRDLTTHLLKGGVRDDVRMNGRINANQEAYNIRARFGFGRKQKKTHPNTWWYQKHKMPTCDVSQFKAMDTHLRSMLMILFESSSLFIQQHDPMAFNNPDRNKIFSSRFNKLMGFEDSLSQFEYVDIILSRNTILRKHIDGKNDHRRGYNQCAVYSFYQFIDGLEFKVSVVMTMRTHVGAAFDDIAYKIGN